MEKFIFIYTVFCFMTVHLKFTVSDSIINRDDVVTTSDQQQQVTTEPSSLFMLFGNRNNFDSKNLLQNLRVENNLNSGSGLRNVNVTLAPLQQSTQNVEKSDSDLLKTTRSAADVDSTELEIPHFLDFESPKHSTDNVLNNSATRHVNKDAKIVHATSEPRKTVTVKEKEKVLDDDDETMTTSKKKENQDDTERDSSNQNYPSLDSQKQPKQYPKISQLPQNYHAKKQMPQVNQEYKPQEHTQSPDTNIQQYAEEWKLLQLINKQPYGQEEQPVRQQDKIEQITDNSQLPRQNLKKLSELYQQLSSLNLFGNLNKSQQHSPERFNNLFSKTEQPLPQNQLTDRIKDNLNDENDDDYSDTDTPEASEEYDAYEKKINSTDIDKDEDMHQEPPKRMLQPQVTRHNEHDQKQPQRLPTNSESKTNAESKYEVEDKSVYEETLEDVANNYGRLYNSEDNYDDAYSNETLNSKETFDYSVSEIKGYVQDKDYKETAKTDSDYQIVKIDDYEYDLDDDDDDDKENVKQDPTVSEIDGDEDKYYDDKETDKTDSDNHKAKKDDYDDDNKEDENQDPDISDIDDDDVEDKYYDDKGKAKTDSDTHKAKKDDYKDDSDDKEYGNQDPAIHNKDDAKNMYGDDKEAAEADSYSHKPKTDDYENISNEDETGGDKSYSHNKDNYAFDNDNLGEKKQNIDSNGQTVLGDNVNNKDDSASIDSDTDKTDAAMVDTEKGRIINASSDVLPRLQSNSSTWLSILKDLEHAHIDKDNLFDQENTDNDEDYDDEDNKEDSEVDKKDDTGILGDYDNDDGDEEYSVTKWTEKNDDVDNDKDYEDGDDDDDFDESKNQNAVEILDELPKKSKPLTAPTSMVLFYTWMIVAVLIILVGISTYRSHCKGFRFPWTKGSSNPKDDCKRLMEHEFV